MLNKSRIVGLDYLRGLAALFIMLYHYISWTFGRFDASTFLGKIGVYGVSIFYILSGITLYHVYNQGKVSSLKFWKDFFKKRVLRIYPLMWFVIICSIALYAKKVDFIDLVLNLTGLFGFIKWDVYLSTGLWSIGNELVFYSLFPLLIISIRYNKLIYFIVGLISAVFFCYFAFFVFKGQNDWRNYVNPLNQFFLFYSGVTIAYFNSDKKFSNNVLILTFTVCLITFVFAPVDGELNILYSSYWRILYSLLSMVFCFVFLNWHGTESNMLTKGLLYLGEISYGVYLIHPIAYEISGIINSYFISIGFASREMYRLLFAVILTFIVSGLSFKYFEMFFVKLGKNKLHNA
jgi:exopolysaccharide production protein ExoZ